MFLYILSVKKLTITAVKKTHTHKLITFKKKRVGMYDYQNAPKTKSTWQ